VPCRFVPPKSRSDPAGPALAVAGVGAEPLSVRPVHVLRRAPPGHVPARRAAGAGADPAGLRVSGRGVPLSRVGPLGGAASILHARARRAQRSLADAVAGRLEHGYDQMLGRRFDGGVDLSGGEWQKVALGRAYMRDAQVLILDEPTASLDARAEYEVFLRFAELTKGRMAV